MDWQSEFQHNHYCLISDKPVFREVELFLYYYLCRICLYDSGAPLYASDGRQILIGEYLSAPVAWYLQLGVEYQGKHSFCVIKYNHYVVLPGTSLPRA